MTILSIKEDYMIVDREGTTSFGELGRGIKPPISIHVSRWCVVDCPVQWEVVMEILVVLLGLVNNEGRHEAFPISSCEYK